MRLWVVLWIFSLLLAETVAAQHSLPQHLFFHTIDQENGLSHNTVLKLHFDSDGFLWIATIDGLNRFDGQHALVYKAGKDSTQLSDGFIHGIAEDALGNFWISTRNGGVNYFDRTKGVFRKYTSKNNKGLANSDMANICFVDDAGTVIVGLYKEGLYVYRPEDDVFQALGFVLPNGQKKRLSHVESGSGKHSGRYQFLFEHKFFEVDAQALRTNTSAFTDTLYLPVLRSRTLPRRSSGPAKFFADASGRIWFLDATDRIQLWDGGQTTYLPDLRGTEGQRYRPQTLPMYESEQGHFYFYHDNGLLIADLSTQRAVHYRHHPSMKGAITSGELRSLVLDQQQTIWVGSWGGGISMAVQQQWFEHYGTHPGSPIRLEHPFTIGLHRSSDGTVWTAHHAGLERIDLMTGKHWLYASGKTSSALSHNTVWGISEGTSYLWLATGNGINAIAKSDLYRADWNAIPIRRFEHHQRTKDGFQLRSELIRSIHEDAEGRLWIGYDGHGVQTIHHPEQLFSLGEVNEWKWTNAEVWDGLTVFSFNELNSGTMYVGTRTKGLLAANLSERRIEELPIDPSAQGGSGFRDVRMVTSTLDGTLWMATYGGGITIWNPENGQFKRLTTENGMPDNGVYSVMPDQNGFIWAPTNNGLVRINAEKHTIQVFTRDHGLQNNEFNTGAWHTDTEGWMYAGGVNGFNRFHPNRFSEAAMHRRISFDKLSVLGETWPIEPYLNPKTPLQLSYNQRFFELGFTTPEFRFPSLLRFQYRLNRTDEGWVDIGQQRILTFAGLEHGAYALDVRTRLLSESDWSSASRFHFMINPPFYATWTFRVISMASLFLLVSYAIWFASTRRLRARVQQLELEQRLQRDRERISRDLHDNVGAQLTNLISGLRLVERYQKVDDRQRIQELIASLKDEASFTIAQLRETIWALSRPEVPLKTFFTHVEEYTQRLQQSHTEVHFECDITSSEDEVVLSPLQALNLFRIVQEAVQNALKHSSGTKIRCSVETLDDSLILQISDNGRFKPQIDAAHYGIGNMEKRCNELQGRFQLIPTESGTVIRIHIPLVE